MSIFKVHQFVLTTVLLAGLFSVIILFLLPRSTERVQELIGLRYFTDVASWLVVCLSVPKLFCHTREQIELF